MAKLFFDAQHKEFKDMGFRRMNGHFIYPPSWMLHGIIASKRTNSVIISNLSGIESEVYQSLIPFFNDEAFEAKKLINKDIPRLQRLFGKPKHVYFYIHEKSNTVTLNKSEYHKQEKHNSILVEDSDFKKDKNILSHDWVVVPVHFKDIDVLFRMHQKNMFKTDN